MRGGCTCRSELVGEPRTGIPDRRTPACILAWLVFGLWAWSPLALHAHNGDVSFAIVRIDGESLRVEVEMSAECAMALMGVPIGTQGIPPQRDDLLPPLTKVAPDVYRFTLGAGALELREARVEFREEDGIAFFLTFALPLDIPYPPRLACDARYLDALPSVHRAAVSLVDAQGGVMAGKVLTAEKHVAEFRLPDR